ncbi:hypothetical protein CLV46_1896 [Diaminobutyricimonas aerilata]|uniref:Uncharacterized protein n=1 Tax=Diaminobutyricimonas aerilata TaxID=1162967 RepID=A0A2M9CKA5_9MICO|nr:hypothetical protein [Diaminobutyricimonas aerilata]PJJ72329.1 hypothetical protein CLV46_1896 [Diaminobutyricimonas aerilata]
MTFAAGELVTALKADVIGAVVASPWGEGAPDIVAVETLETGEIRFFRAETVVATNPE